MNPSSNGEQLAPVVPTEARLGQMGGDEKVTILYSSLPMDGEEGRDNLALVLTGERTILWDVAPVTVCVTNVVTCEQTGWDEETGELATRMRMLLIDTNGQIYVTTSPVCYNYLLRLIAVYGAFPWPNGRNVRFQKTKTRAGKDCMTCTIQPSSTVPTTTSAPKKGKQEK